MQPRSHVPIWAVASSVTAPIALIGGWSVAAARRHDGFSSVHDTISALAASDAPDRWLMTTAFLIMGLCHVLTACALLPAATLGRFVLLIGGATAWGVAAFPLPPQTTDKESAGHFAFALTSFVAMAVWPVLATRAGHRILSWRVTTAATAVLLAQLAWFALALQHHAVVGLAERVAAGSQALWPFVVVMSLRRERQRR